MITGLALDIVGTVNSTISRSRLSMSVSSGHPVIEVTGLDKHVASPDGELVILHDINLTILSAEAVAIVGASGSGKSTLLGLMAGLDVPTSGSVMIQ
jgi:putative ABC transport system ATP-binding protein